MPDLTNLNAQDQADFIRDDTHPALRLRNTSTGSGGHIEGLAATSTASIDVLYLAGTGAANILSGNATQGMQLVFSPSSVASGAVMKFAQGALVSATSVLATTGGVAGTYALRVEVGDGNFGWIPVYPDGAVTGAAI